MVNPRADRQVIIYTAVFGNKDNLKEPNVPLPGFKLVAFTDNPKIQTVKDTAWDVRLIKKRPFPSPVKSARYYKTHPHKLFPEYQISIWIDGSFIIWKNPMAITAALNGVNMAVRKHGLRGCLYEEARACIRRKKDREDVIRMQTKEYRKQGHPKNAGLVETGVLFRKHNEPDIIEFNEMWWGELERKSIRDQISFPFVARKLKLRYTFLESNRLKKLFHLRQHKKAQNLHTN